MGSVDGDAGTVEVGCYHRRVERARKSRRYPPQNSAIGCSRVCVPSRAPLSFPGCAPSTGELIPGDARTLLTQHRSRTTVNSF